MKFVTALVLLLCAATFANAQSFRLIEGQRPIFYMPAADELWDDHVYHLNVQNVSNSTVTMALHVDESGKMETHRQRFCIGSACYNSGVVDTDEQGHVYMKPNMVDSSFKIEFNPGTEIGISRLIYSFYNISKSSDDRLDIAVDFYVGVTDVTPEQEQRFMSLAMPNPANDAALITYSLPNKATSATIVVRDILGNVVNTMPISGQQGVAALSTSQLASGTYMYSLVVNGMPVSQQRLIVAH